MRKYLSHFKLATLESEGIHHAYSERIKAVKFKPDKEGIRVYAVTSGALVFKWDRWDLLKEEIDEFREVLLW